MNLMAMSEFYLEAEN